MGHLWSWGLEEFLLTNAAPGLILAKTLRQGCVPSGDACFLRQRANLQRGGIGLLTHRYRSSEVEASCVALSDTRSR